MKKGMIQALLILGIIALPLMAGAAGTVVFLEDFEHADYVLGAELPSSPTVAAAGGIPASGKIWEGFNWQADGSDWVEGVDFLASEVFTSNSLISGGGDKALEICDDVTTKITDPAPGSETQIYEMTGMDQDVINGIVEFDYRYVGIWDDDPALHTHFVAFFPQEPGLPGGLNSGTDGVNKKAALFVQIYQKKDGGTPAGKGMRFRVAGASWFAVPGVTIEDNTDYHIKSTFSCVARTSIVEVSHGVTIDYTGEVLLPSETAVPDMVVDGLEIVPWKATTSHFQIDNIKLTDLGTSTEADEVWKLY